MPRHHSDINQPSGADLTVIHGDGYPVARFSAYVESTVGTPKGDLKLRLGVPYDQIPHVMPLLKEVGGVVFEVTVRRVPYDQLPEPGWT